MGRRRTLINDFGANWTTERVSAKKKMHGWTTNMIVIQIIIRFRVISLIMNIAIIRIITLEPLYCIASFHILCFLNFFSCFHINSICFSCFHINFFFLCFLSNFFRSSLIFFLFSQCIKCYIQWFAANMQKKKKKKVWCVVSAMSSRSNQTSFRQARRKSMDWLDCISVHGSENSRVETHSKSQWL